MNIAILGTRGIPNHYGGFEQFAEYLSLGLVSKGHAVTVYNSHTHPYQQTSWQGVNIIHCKDPEDKMGTAGQFIYDLNCIKDARKRHFDIILQLGYTSSSVWGWLLPRRKSIVTTNMDGLEWKRSKYSAKVRRFLRHAEKLGVKYSDYLIADSVGIQQYLKEKYSKGSLFIPYGAHVFEQPDERFLGEFGLEAYGYNMLIARLEPENSIEIILEGVRQANHHSPFIVVGKHETKYGVYLKEKFKDCPAIRFIGSLYDIGKLNNLRYFSKLYFHGHTVGGTNPSLLEAMASRALIAAHANIFNQSILGQDAYYFTNPDEVASLLSSIDKAQESAKLAANVQKIKDIYAWPIIVDQYVAHFEDILKTRKKGYIERNGH